MKRPRPWLALPLALLVAGATAAASDIKDQAGLFSEAAVRKAQDELNKIEKDSTVPITIETVPSLDGEPIHDVTTRHAVSAGAHGYYVLIAKKEHKTYSEPSRGYQKYISRERCSAIDNAFSKDFMAGRFDDGLNAAVAKIRSTFDEAQVENGGPLKSTEPTAIRRDARPGRAGRPVAVPGRASGGLMSLLLPIGLGLLALFLVIRVLGAIFGGNRGGYNAPNQMGGMGGPGYRGGPGMGGPGYGGAPGGGGFMSSMFGGIGGALAGNWLYDQFSGGRHANYNDQAGNYDPNAGIAPTEAAPEWGEGGAGADWGGGAADAGGGADWGGGAADAGGGDWGGGGGGDWGGGGGGDDGASW